MENKKRTKIDFRMPVRMLRGSKRYLLLAALMLVIAVLAAYAIPYVTSFIIDYCIGTKEVRLPKVVADLVTGLGGREFFRANFYLLPLLIVVIALINGFCIFLRGRSIAKASEGFSKKLRDELYIHLQSVPYDYYKHMQTGDLIQRCTSDIDTIRRFITNQLLEILRTLTMLIVALVIMFTLNTKMALVSVAVMPILCLSSFVYFKLVRSQFTLSDEAEGALSAALQENLTGMRVVRAFAQQKSEVEKFTAFNKDFFKKTYKLISLLGFYWGFSDMFGYGQILLTMSVGTVFVVGGTLTVGNLLLFVTYTSMLIWPVRQLGRVLADLGKAAVSVGRLNEILDAEPEKEPGKALECPVSGDIVFSNVCFGYDKPDDVLSKVSFTAPEGKTIAILGSTGSGKTSLVQLLQRLYTVTDGEITIGGVNINDIERHHLRRNIGIVLQEPFLYSRSVMENIRITNPDAADAEVFEAARVAAVHDVICAFDNGYETTVGEKGVTLSGGQRQRVAIARMLMQNAPILIFDDSLSAVDTETDMAIRRALNMRKGSSTTFIISHRITTLCEADLIIVLENGKLVQSGTHESLINEEGLYRRIAQIQDYNGQECLV